MTKSTALPSHRAFVYLIVFVFFGFTVVDSSNTSFAPVGRQAVMDGRTTAQGEAIMNDIQHDADKFITYLDESNSVVEARENWKRFREALRVNEESAHRSREMLAALLGWADEQTDHARRFFALYYGDAKSNTPIIGPMVTNGKQIQKEFIDPLLSSSQIYHIVTGRNPSHIDNSQLKHTTVINYKERRNDVITVMHENLIQAINLADVNDRLKVFKDVYQQRKTIIDCSPSSSHNRALPLQDKAILNLCGYNRNGYRKRNLGPHSSSYENRFDDVASQLVLLEALQIQLSAKSESFFANIDGGGHHLTGNDCWLYLDQVVINDEEVQELLDTATGDDASSNGVDDNSSRQGPSSESGEDDSSSDSGEDDSSSDSSDDDSTSDASRKPKTSPHRKTKKKKTTDDDMGECDVDPNVAVRQALHVGLRKESICEIVIRCQDALLDGIIEDGIPLDHATQEGRDLRLALGLTEVALANRPTGQVNGEWVRLASRAKQNKATTTQVDHDEDHNTDIPAVLLLKNVLSDEANAALVKFYDRASFCHDSLTASGKTHIRVATEGGLPTVRLGAYTAVEAIDADSIEKSLFKLVTQLLDTVTKLVNEELSESDTHRHLPGSKINGVIIKVGPAASYGYHQDHSNILCSPRAADTGTPCVTNGGSLPTRDELMVLTLVLGTDGTQANATTVSWSRNKKKPLGKVTTYNNYIHFQFPGTQSNNIYHKSDPPSAKTQTKNPPGATRIILTFRMFLLPEKDGIHYDRGFKLDKVSGRVLKKYGCCKVVENRRAIKNCENVAEASGQTRNKVLPTSPHCGTKRKINEVLAHGESTEASDSATILKQPTRLRSAPYPMMKQYLDKIGYRPNTTVGISKSSTRSETFSHHTFVSLLLDEDQLVHTLNGEEQQPALYCKEEGIPFFPGDIITRDRLPLRSNRYGSDVIHADFPHIACLQQPYKNCIEAIRQAIRHVDLMKEMKNSERYTVEREATKVEILKHQKSKRGILVGGSGGSCQKSGAYAPDADTAKPGDVHFQIAAPQNMTTTDNQLMQENQRVKRPLAVFVCLATWEETESQCGQKKKGNKNKYSQKAKDRFLFLGYLHIEQSLIGSLTDDEIIERMANDVDYWTRNAFHLSYLQEDHLQSHLQHSLSLEQYEDILERQTKKKPYQPFIVPREHDKIPVAVSLEEVQKHVDTEYQRLLTSRNRNGVGDFSGGDRTAEGEECGDCSDGVGVAQGEEGCGITERSVVAYTTSNHTANDSTNATDSESGESDDGSACEIGVEISSHNDPDRMTIGGTGRKVLQHNIRRSLLLKVFVNGKHHLEQLECSAKHQLYTLDTKDVLCVAGLSNVAGSFRYDQTRSTRLCKTCSCPDPCSCQQELRGVPLSGTHVDLLPIAMQTRPGPMANPRLDCGSIHFISNVAIMMEENGYIDHVTEREGYSNVYEFNDDCPDDIRTDLLMEVIFMSVVNYLHGDIGKMAAYKAHTNSTRSIPKRNEAKGYCAFVERYLAKYNVGLSGFTSGQYRSAAPELIRTSLDHFTILLMLLASSVVTGLSLLQRYITTANRSEVCRRQVVRLLADTLATCSDLQDLDSYNFIAHVAIRNVELVFPGVFGEITPESIYFGHGASFGMDVVRCVRGDGKCQCRQCRLMRIHNKVLPELDPLSDTELLLLCLKGEIRNGRKVYIDTETGEPFHPAITEHWLCKVHYWIVWSHSSRCGSEIPQPTNGHCHPVHPSYYAGWAGKGDASFKIICDAFERDRTQSEESGSTSVFQQFPVQLRLSNGGSAD